MGSEQGFLHGENQRAALPRQQAPRQRTPAGSTTSAASTSGQHYPPLRRAELPELVDTPKRRLKQANTAQNSVFGATVPIFATSYVQNGAVKS